MSNTVNSTLEDSVFLMGNTSNLMTDLSMPSGGFAIPKSDLSGCLNVLSADTFLPKNDYGHSMNIFDRFLDREKHDFSESELAKINKFFETITKEFYDFKISAEVAGDRSVLLSLINSDVKIHLHTFFNGESDDIYFFSIFKESNYLFNGAGHINDVVSQIKNDINSLVLYLNSHYLINIENNVVVFADSSTEVSTSTNSYGISSKITA